MFVIAAPAAANIKSILIILPITLCGDS
jgi:hypothetical protein